MYPGMCIPMCTLKCAYTAVRCKNPPPSRRKSCEDQGGGGGYSLAVISQSFSKSRGGFTREALLDRIRKISAKKLSNARSICLRKSTAQHRSCSENQLKLLMIMKFALPPPRIRTELNDKRYSCHDFRHQPHQHAHRLR